nr:methyl-accepting chemotaxis protein [Priestia megaterium]
MKKNKVKKIKPKVKQKKEKTIKQKNKSPINWKNVKIGQKYVAIFLITAALFIAATTIVYVQLTKGQKNMDQISEQSIRVNEMTQLSSLIQGKDVQIADYLLSEDYKYVNMFKEYQAEFDALVKKIKPTMKTNKQKEIFKKIVENDASINDTFFNEMVASVQSGEDTMANSLRSYSTRLRTETIQLVNDLSKIVRQEQETSVNQASETMNYSTIVLMIANLTAIIVGILLMILISKKTSLHLSNVVKITSEVANGNLQATSMNYQGKDEIGQLAQSVNQMKDNIKGILFKVKNASNSVSSRSEELTQSANEVREGSNQIASTMEELSSGAETQATSAGDLSENMNDFVRKVQSSEANGQEVMQSSQKVQQLTSEGTELMKQSVSQMKQIDSIVAEAVEKVQGLDHQSNEISKLVLVIKDIADQTNLLSLNAAIEAARAGEHGKGFAVVADEVRRLSEQVASSVGEITTIVQNIQSETTQVVGSLNSGYHEVKEGTAQIETTGKNFTTINHAVRDMTNKINTISENLKEIAANSVDMNQLIEEIASVSEESAAGVEQAAASAQQTSSSMEEVSSNANELAELAEKLNEEINTFKL